MKTTGNLGLKKPDGTDIVDITDLNGNMDILDTAVKAVQDHAADAVKHITAAERTAWNAKASTTAATASAAGLMAAADKAKLDGVAAGANNYVHPNHTGDVTSSGDGVTAIAAGVIVNADVNAAAAIDASKIGTGVVSNAEFGFLDGVTSGIQGQLNAKANLTTTPQQTTADITYYVRTDGNDGNTGLGNTAGGAFKTWQKALDSLPKVINHIVNIYIADGTYNENVSVKGFSGGGTLTLIGNTTNAALVMVASVDLYENFLAVGLISFTSTTATRDSFTVNRCVGFRINDCRAIAVASGWSGIITYFSAGVIANGTYSNKGCGVNGAAASQIDLISVAGTGNTIGLGSSDGAVVTKFNLTLTGTQVESASGGTVTSGVLNPWGDNTQDSRPILWGGSLVSSTTTTASAWNLLRYGISTNQQGGYNATTGVFTSPQTGWYKIKATVQLQSAPAGAYSIAVLQNGVNRWIADYKNTAVTSHLFLGGDMCLYMPAGNTIAIQLHTDSNAVVIVNGMDTTHFEIVRVA